MTSNESLDEHPVILCVDDEQSILKSLTRLFASKEYHVITAESGAIALDIMEQQTVNLIVSDMRMPQMTGAEFLGFAAQKQPDAYRILMTGYADLTSTISAINNGKIHRYIQKPWDNQLLVEYVEEGLSLYRLTRANKLLTKKLNVQNKQLKELNGNLEKIVQQRTSALQKAMQGLNGMLRKREEEQRATLEVLYNIINSHPYLSGDFAIKVGESCYDLAIKLNLPPHIAAMIGKAGQFSEIGKVCLTSGELTRSFEKLNNNERAHYYQHAQFAEDILSPAIHLHDMGKMIAQQYTRYSSEPFPLDDEHYIQTGAQILSVCRDYWMLTHGNKTDIATDQNSVVGELRKYTGTKYHPDILAVFIELLVEQRGAKKRQFVEGFTIGQLKSGMVLKRNVYSSKMMLLLPKGHMLTAHTIEKLNHYQRCQIEPILVDIEPQTD